MRRILLGALAAFAMIAIAASAGVRPGRRRELHRHHSGPRDRFQRRRAAGRDGHRVQPVDDRRADAGHQRERHRTGSRPCRRASMR